MADLLVSVYRPWRKCEMEELRMAGRHVQSGECRGAARPDGDLAYSKNRQIGNWKSTGKTGEMVRHRKFGNDPLHATLKPLQFR